MVVLAAVFLGRILGILEAAPTLSLALHEAILSSFDVIPLFLSKAHLAVDLAPR